MRDMIEREKAVTDEDVKEAISDRKLLLMALMKQAELVIEGDESLAEMEGSSDPKGQAPKTGAAGKSGETKYSLESTDGRARLITRLADDRKIEFAHVGQKGVSAGKIGADSFGSFGKDVTYFFYNDGDYAHTFIIPDQLIPRLKAALKQIAADKKANALQYFSMQHGMYHKGNGTFDTFGPRREYPGGKLADSMGVLRDANGTTQAGEQLTRIDGTSRNTSPEFKGIENLSTFNRAELI